MCADSIIPEFNSLGDIIRWLRKRKGYTQSQLASLIGVKPQTIGKYETGIIKYPPIDKLQLIRYYIDDRDDILEFLMHDILDLPESTEYYESFAQAISPFKKADPEFIDYLGSKNIELSVPLDGEFFSLEIQKLIVAWSKATEKDKKTVSFILGFDYEPKDDPAPGNYQRSGSREDGGKD